MPPVPGWSAPDNAQYRSPHLKRIAVSMSAKRHIGGAGSRLYVARSKPILNHPPDAEPAAELLQRRWFAAAAAARSLEAECAVLLEVLEVSRQACGAGRARLPRVG